MDSSVFKVPQNNILAHFVKFLINRYSLDYIFRYVTIIVCDTMKCRVTPVFNPVFFARIISHREYSAKEVRENLLPDRNYVTVRRHEEWLRKYKTGGTT